MDWNAFLIATVKSLRDRAEHMLVRSQSKGEGRGMLPTAELTTSMMLRELAAAIECGRKPDDR